MSNADVIRERFRAAVRSYVDEINPWLRGLIATRLYRDRRDLPIARLRAEVLAQTLEAIDPVIIPEALISGSAIRRMRVHDGISDSEGWRRFALFPEAGGFDELVEAPEEVRAVYRFWRTPEARRYALENPIRDANRWLIDFGIASPWGTCGGHTLPDHAILLESGIDELVRRLDDKSDEPGSQFSAMRRCLEGLSHHIEHQARVMRAVEADKADGDTLIDLRFESPVCVCEWIAHSRPTTFHQALQLLYFSNFADRAGNIGDASSFGRVDRLLIDFYRNDIATGRLTRDHARELLSHFAIKIWGDQESRNLTVGGVDPESGDDSTNELSWMFLEAMDATGMTFDLSVRVHRDTPRDFLEYAASIMKRRFGRPDVYNDEIAIPALVGAGVELEDARDYAPLGCVEIMIPGRTTGRTMAMGLNHLKILELVLNRGVCLVTGRRVWDDVPDAYPDFDSLLAEMETRIEEVVRLGCEIIRVDQLNEPNVLPRPWLTVLSRGGIDDGRDLTAGQPKYDPVGVTMDGFADTVNSLEAVRRLVFEEQICSFDQIREILVSDWRGYESLRRRVIHDFPRYGADHHEVDGLAARIAAHYALCFDHEQTAYGGRFHPMIFGVTTGLLTGRGRKTGATVSGRRAGTIIAQSLQPSATGPQGSPTEVLRSAAAIDFRRFPGGVSNVQSFDPALFAGSPGDGLVCDLIAGYFDLGGMELAMNFVSADELKEARRHPDEHPYLMVRLFGMSARFVLLSPELQDVVIAKVEAASP